ncbi:MAG: terminase family protein [Terricaulis sp.]|nr:terminase family protein [Terricaulis sp.]
MRLLLDDWDFWGRAEQLPPAGAWRAWVFLGGRGAGKTRAGAEWVSALVRDGKARRIALIGPTFHDVREVMVEGPSGLRSLPHARPLYEASRKRLLWENGAEAFCFSAEDPESLRGPQFDAAWADELCFWSYPEETLQTLAHGLRLGAAPRLMATTTPRPTRALKALLARPDTVLTRGATWENGANLAPDFIAALKERWSGSARDRQELLGELIEDAEGALWRRAELEAMRVSEWPTLDRIVVAVDPPAGVGENVAQCGIVAAGVYGNPRRAVVLADASVQGLAPQGWASRAAALARSLGAQAIVAEGNNGGEMVRAVLKAAAPDIPVRLVRASEGKRARAEPIAAFYAQGRVAHAAAFAALEDEMCLFGAHGFSASPDRLDALVWALTDVLLAPHAEPRVRMI